MPTDLSLVPDRKRKAAAQAQGQIEVTILPVFVIITLAMLVMLFADQSFSKATIELMCFFKGLQQLLVFDMGRPVG